MKHVHRNRNLTHPQGPKSGQAQPLSWLMGLWMTAVTRSLLNGNVYWQSPTRMWWRYDMNPGMFEVCFGVWVWRGCVSVDGKLRPPDLVLRYAKSSVSKYFFLEQSLCWLKIYIFLADAICSYSLTYKTRANNKTRKKPRNYQKKTCFSRTQWLYDPKTLLKGNMNNKILIYWTVGIVYFIFVMLNIVSAMASVASLHHICWNVVLKFTQEGTMTMVVCLIYLLWSGWPLITWHFSRSVLDSISTVENLLGQNNSGYTIQ